jgi:hypothetical protein
VAALAAPGAEAATRDLDGGSGTAILPPVDDYCLLARDRSLMRSGGQYLPLCRLRHSDFSYRRIRRGGALGQLTLLAEGTGAGDRDYATELVPVDFTQPLMWSIAAISLGANRSTVVASAIPDDGLLVESTP